MRRGLLVMVLWSLIGAFGIAEQGAESLDHDRSGAVRDIHLTVYQDGFALVRERRTLNGLQAGINRIRFPTVAQTIDATSARFRSLTDPLARVVEQDFEFDLADDANLLRRYVGRRVTVHTHGERAYRGTLLSFDSRHLVLSEGKDGPVWLFDRRHVHRVQFPDLPRGLVARPTLNWTIDCHRAGPQKVEVSYLAKAIRWRADYTLVLTAEDRADISGLVTIDNQAGVDFPNARIKLLSGQPYVDYRRLPWSTGIDYYRLVRTRPRLDRAAEPGRRIGDYHIYPMPKRLSLSNKQIVQVELLAARQIAVRKVYLYDGARIAGPRRVWVPTEAYGRGASNTKVNVLIELDNTRDAHLGLPLPKGKVRVFLRDASGSLQFVGEDAIPNTAKDERAVLSLGNAFDLVGQRRVVEFKKVTNRTMEEAFEILLRNHKKEPVAIRVLEKLYRARQWDIIDKTHDFELLDSRTIIFPVNVPADGETVVRYRVRYSY